MNHTKIDTADIDSRRRELSAGGLGIVVALLVCRGIDFSCVSTGGPIQLYTNPSLCSKSKDDEISSVVARHRWSVGINPSTGPPSTMDEDVLVLRASRRFTQAPILTSLGAISRHRDPSTTPSTHHAAAFATLAAPKCAAFV